MSILGRKHLDSPIDYRELWSMLHQRVEELVANEAVKAAQADDERDVRRHQGAYRFGYTITSEMDRLLEEARKSYGPLRQALDNDGA